jgi:hypothetical protein
MFNVGGIRRLDPETDRTLRGKSSDTVLSHPFGILVHLDAFVDPVSGDFQGLEFRHVSSPVAGAKEDFDLETVTFDCIGVFLLEEFAVGEPLEDGALGGIA